MLKMDGWEKYLDRLSPELQAKVKECKNKDDIIKLAAREGIELPDEALDGVTGGTGSETGGDCTQGYPVSLTSYFCPKCQGKGGKLYKVDSLIGQMYSRYAKEYPEKGYNVTHDYIMDCDKDMGQWFWACYL